ncbi:MAG: ExbD/TolR family protein [Bacteroidia bacterium]
MAEVNTGDGGGGHGKHEKKRAKKASTKIDMTPMVDLAFLLLTFFVLTSTFNKPKTMEINYPDPKVPPDKDMKVHNAITFLMSKDNTLYYYNGQFYPPGNEDGKPPTTLTKTDFSKDGLHKLLLERYKPETDQLNALEVQYKNHAFANDSIYKAKVRDVKGAKDALTVLVKADDKAIYKNMIDLIDELNVCNIGKYAVVDMGQAELDLLKAEK